MLAFVKVIISIAPIFLDVSQAPFSPQNSSICKIREKSLTAGDLARWYSEKSECKSIRLDSTICDSAEMYIKNISDMQQLSKAENGRRNVYLGPNFVISANSADLQGNNRQQESAFQMIENNELDRLVVPKFCKGARTDSFLIRERIPIENPRSLYYFHPDKFTEPVKQLARFIMQFGIDDIISRAAKPRFDNITPFLDEGIEKIALIDLDGLKASNWRDVWNIIVFFPFHYEEILEITRVSHPEWIQEHQKEFEEARYHHGMQNFIDFIAPSSVQNEWEESSKRFIKNLQNEYERAVKECMKGRAPSLKEKVMAFIGICSYEDAHAVKLLLQEPGIPIKIKNEALIAATLAEKKDSVGLLLAEADISSQTREYAFTQAIRREYKELSRLFLKDPNISSIVIDYVVADVASKEVIEYLFKESDLSAFSAKVKGKILVKAAILGWTDLVEILWKDPFAKGAALQVILAEKLEDRTTEEAKIGDKLLEQLLREEDVPSQDIEMAALFGMAGLKAPKQRLKQLLEKVKFSSEAVKFSAIEILKQRGWEDIIPSCWFLSMEDPSQFSHFNTTV
jgi:hypothetical protein